GEFYHTIDGSYLPVSAFERGDYKIQDRTDFYDGDTGAKLTSGYKDLHKITFDFFKDPDTGLIATILYVISMLVLGYHLWHGFASAFQSLGMNNPKYNALIRGFGKLFSVIVPLL